MDTLIMKSVSETDYSHIDALLNNFVIGYIDSSPSVRNYYNMYISNSQSSDNLICIDFIFVTPNFRKGRKGLNVGKSLVSTLEEFAVKSDCDIFLPCVLPGSVEFWKKMGYSVNGCFGFKKLV